MKTLITEKKTLSLRIAYFRGTKLFYKFQVCNMNKIDVPFENIDGERKFLFKSVLTMYLLLVSMGLNLLSIINLF